MAEAYTGTVLRHFEDELQQVVALTFLIPLLIGTGGNTGTQITTTLTRALAVGDVAPRDVLRVVSKEWGVAILRGALMALATLIRAWTLGVGPEVLGVAVTAASDVPATLTRSAGKVTFGLPRKSPLSSSPGSHSNNSEPTGRGRGHPPEALPPALPD